jgi:tRNA-2-methylthio-N6-dimethylallyladenosine synthase
VQSRPDRGLVREARWMVAGGARVITLLGQTVNAYGEDLPRPESDAARGTGRTAVRARRSPARAAGDRGLERIRLVTLHPPT